MKEYRCVKCHKLLMKLTAVDRIRKIESASKQTISAQDVDYHYHLHDQIEIKCSKCGKINKLSA